LRSEWSRYRIRTRKSKKLFERASRVLAGGVSHNSRYHKPYPLYGEKAQGKHIWDEDGNRYTDYWMGHTALILGHSPREIVSVLLKQVRYGTLLGLSNRPAVELAEQIGAAVKSSEMVRFCNTGAEATTYLVRLARAFTGKRVILKAEGGWHGYGTQLNKGVHSPFKKTEGLGILKGEQAHVETIPFNNSQAAENAIRENAKDLACVFVEPVLGGGGCIAASREYLKGLRELTMRIGSLLAFDEIITGFRLSYGGAQEFYGIDSDLTTFGKIAGGGLPLGVVAGRKEILALADPRNTGSSRFVSIGGGTFSENPLTMSAGLATLRFLESNQDSVYRRLASLGAKLRKGVDAAFARAGIPAFTTGEGSLFLTHFANRAPKNALDSASGDEVARLSYHVTLIANDGIFVLPGHLGAISTRHNESDIVRFVEATSRFAERWARQKRKQE
jgi:glutamate-1-semialdehyde 2,1-aminomutase